MIDYRINTDQELCSLLRHGDEGAFARIYELYSQRIYTNLKRLLKDEDLAQELLQEVFVRIWDKRASIAVETSFKSYLYRVSENLVRDFFRKASKDKKMMEQLMLAASELYIDNETLYIDKENNQLLHKAIDTLPPQRRRIFTLCKIEGKSYSEVSELTGISVSTINDHIVKATKTIRTYFVLSGDSTVVLVLATFIVAM
jgi:RNA polymerase sigma-70 factor (family 1)